MEMTAFMAPHVRKIFIFSLVSSCLFCFAPLARAAVISEIRGDVSVKTKNSAKWLSARPTLILNAPTEIKVGKDSECTIAFDGDLENILTLKDNSLVKIERLTPVNIYISRGRAFFLIENAETAEKLEITTPTSAVKLKEAGGIIEVLDNCSNMKCFENNIYAYGLKGKETAGEMHIAEGFGISVCINGLPEKLFKLTDADSLQWGDFLGSIDELRDNAFYSEDGD